MDFPNLIFLLWHSFSISHRLFHTTIPYLYCHRICFKTRYDSCEYNFISLPYIDFQLHYILIILLRWKYLSIFNRHGLRGKSAEWSRVIRSSNLIIIFRAKTELITAIWWNQIPGSGNIMFSRFATHTRGRRLRQSVRRGGLWAPHACAARCSPESLSHHVITGINTIYLSRPVDLCTLLQRCHYMFLKTLYLISCVLSVTIPPPPFTRSPKRR